MKKIVGILAAAALIATSVFQQMYLLR